MHILAQFLGALSRQERMTAMGLLMHELKLSLPDAEAITDQLVPAEGSPEEFVPNYAHIGAVLEGAYRQEWWATANAQDAVRTAESALRAAQEVLAEHQHKLTLLTPEANHA